SGFMRVLPHASVRTKTREISTGSVDELTCVSSYYSTARLRGSQGMRWQTSRIRVLGEIVAGEVWGVRLRRFHLRSFAATADKSRLRAGQTSHVSGSPHGQAGGLA